MGDDCALLRPNAGLDLAVTTDMLVEGRHFAADAAPRSLGHKALAVNLKVPDLMRLCLAENDRRMAKYDPRLLRPVLVPRLVKLALKFL